MINGLIPLPINIDGKKCGRNSNKFTLVLIIYEKVNKQTKTINCSTRASFECNGKNFFIFLLWWFIAKRNKFKKNEMEKNCKSTATLVHLILFFNSSNNSQPNEIRRNKSNSNTHNSFFVLGFKRILTFLYWTCNIFSLLLFLFLQICKRFNELNIFELLVVSMKRWAKCGNQWKLETVYCIWIGHRFTET